MARLNFGVLIVKVVAAVILFVAFAVGIHAHVESKWTKDFKQVSDMCEFLNEGRKQGKQLGMKNEDLPPYCPTAAIPMELTFIIFTGIVFVVSIVMILVGLFVRDFKNCDAFYSILAGIIILIVGIVMIISACLIDKFMREFLTAMLKGFGVIKDKPDKVEQKNLKELVADMRKEVLFWNKLVAGCLAVIDGIIYMVAAAIICASRD